MFNKLKRKIFTPDRMVVKNIRIIFNKLKKGIFNPDKTWAKASFTIEAAVVVPICMVIIVSALMTVFNFHDAVVLKAAAASIVPAKYPDAEENENIYTQEVMSYFSRRLLVYKNVMSESSRDDTDITMQNSGDFGISLGIAETILMDSLGRQTVNTRIESLDARKKIIKYKILCDGAEKIGIIGGDN